MELIGKLLSNRYEIIEEIGVGGMAFVYKAKCRLLNRNVAVKVLKPEFAKDDTFVKRFKTEAQSAASLTHPNIVSVYDVGEENGINYIIMELLESRTLKDYIEKKGALSTEETLKISMQIASALEAAHKEHIIHRDIKPQNIVLNKNMVAKVTDFGIAKATTSSTITNFGTTMGSVHYFSPEHAKGGYTDEKSDIYSLGVVMYEMATGRVPFNSDSAVSVALKHIQEAPINPIDINANVSESLNKIILKAMAKNTTSRYKSATEMLQEIHESMNDTNKYNRTGSSVEAGSTQVIPIITDEIIEENIVPNLRTRNPVRRMNLVTSKSLKNDLKQENNDVTDENNIDKNSDKNSDKNMNKRMSKNKKKIIIISVIIAVIILSVLTFFTVKIIKKINADNKPATTFEVPNLVGRNFEEVQKEYVNQNIEVLQDKAEYDLVLAEGMIISQTPEKATTATDRKIYVVVSKGQKMVTVPDVTGKDIKVVKYELEDTLGFVIQLEEEISTKVLANIVISQDPVKDTQLPFGSTIKIKISKGDGKARIIMPSVIGNTEVVANKTLTDLKLTVKVIYGEDKTKTNSVVTAQNYPQNQELKEGDLVEITVNKLSVTKVVSLDLTELKGTTEYTEDIEVKVIASIDGTAGNTVFDKSFAITATKAEFSLNGYTSASLKIYINKKEVKTQTIKFAE
ncbi:MAG: Stk1 family PASTA domain-containing Ser/Thr kinase [Clostridia bacterium]|nr:Stk1 family PASTA domain-containing Ser/Thr kinase [Clostridia bacterium]MDD4386756.1 Stk1 family PASTA domain-containing Ser/Thr kinase [Clostridia bacterium]